MKSYLLTCFLVFFTVVLAAQEKAPDPYINDPKINYVRTWTATAPVYDPAVLVTKPLHDVQQVTQYFDGLGRPLQTVAKQGSLITGGSPVDLVSPVVYDALGRETFKYLPFAANNTGGNNAISNGYFKLNPFQQDSAFNKAQFPGETYYYSKTNFEASPLNRLVEQYAPGNSWVGSEGNTTPNTRRSISHQYLINEASDSVRIWTVSAAGTISTSAMYVSGSLYENVTIDEHKQKAVEYKDKEGKVILKKVQLATAPATGHTGWLCTYYVYDDVNQLRCVIQPRGIELLQAGSWSMTATILNEFCFRYEYDERQRMVSKKVPGAGEVWMVYDGRDRLVLTQDSALRAASPQKWLYTQYDALNRPIATGLWTNNQHRAYHKTQAFASTAYPNLSGQTFEELTRTYYDDYSWAAELPTTLKNFDKTYANTYLLTGNTWPYPQQVEQSVLTKGLVTGTRVKVLGTSPAQELTSIIFYDEKGRQIQMRSQNITGGIDVGTSQYSWSGQPLVTVQLHEKAAPNAQTHLVITNMEYDDLNRLTAVRQSVNSTINGAAYTKPQKLIFTQEYNALGQIQQKRLGAPVIDSLRYEYNIRGWLLGINRAYAKDAHQHNYFGFDLGYDKTHNGIIGNQAYTSAQYNGNIAGTVWKSKGDGEKRKYDFTYDGVNRLKQAAFTQYTGSSFNTSAGLDFSVRSLDYDANGNITNMTQLGWKLGGSVTIDSLLYTYDNSNKLKNVIDRVNNVQTKLGDFRSSSVYMEALEGIKTTAAVDYVYDGNGNMIRDQNKDIGNASNNGIVYNHLNLPTQVTVRTTGGAVKGTITYTYDAVGNKLAKTVQETGLPARTTRYIGGFVYENDTLQFLSQPEGRLRLSKKHYVNGDSGYHYFYDYFLKDHLGNVRMVLTEQQDTSIYMATMEAAYRAKEDALFYNIPQTAYAKSLISGYPTDATTSPNDSVARVNGSGQKVGPSLVLKVMSGDTVNLAVKYFYRGSGSAGPGSDPLNDILSVLAGGIVGTTGEMKGSLLELNNAGTSPLVGALNSFRTANNPATTNKPKSYLNWILFDEQLKYVPASSGAAVVGSTESLQALTTLIEISKSGFLYIYVSNETQNWDVFFDNLSVQHVSGRMLEETHYYPFGLVMSGISSKALNGAPENKYKWNKGSELQNKEFSDGSGLEMYATKLRMLDPQLGRWWQIDSKPDYAQSLYSSMGNNPILHNDPLGDTTIRPSWLYPVVNTGSTAKGFVFGLNGQYQTEPVRGSTVTGIRDTKGGGTNAAGKVKGIDVVRVDQSHGKGRSAIGPHLNINEKVTGLPDPHTPLTTGQFNALKTTGQTLDAIGKVAKPVAIATDVVQMGVAIKTDIQQGTGGDNTIVAGSRVAGGWAGAIGGAKGGAAIGAGIGSFFGPGPGTAVGGFVGGIIGGIGGAIFGSKVGEAAGEKIVEIKNDD